VDFHHTGKDELAHGAKLPKQGVARAGEGLTGKVIKQVPWPLRLCLMWITTTAWRWRSSTRIQMGRTRACAGRYGGYISLTAYDKDLISYGSTPNTA